MLELLAPGGSLLLSMSMERVWISLDEAAEYVSVSTRTIRHWIAEGRLPAKRFGKRIIRVRLADVEACGRDIPTV